ncbi:MULTISPECIES: beta-ketoacyl-ACP synthase III [Kordiimonas]|uniref:beta-ketoacyl-ACP synthase III n=1 Tax=Kordiimonas TaxID=288021 RepID=UPI001FF697BA|nr:MULTISPECIES: beta-ketoacyl-ACP synthase III [Kordiimonas]MCK0068680.1 beta-ketoacyl-ACP synthase III [Kordiimonas laminariae]UTW58035.1 beta-ketoacyl-ACP synthase III [Kordiimonas sp. SCSIO 12603]
MVDVVISGTGVFVPENKITNEELVAAFNDHVDQFNAENAADIEAGLVTAKQHSSAAFIEKASGIKSRHMIEVEGVMDLNRMMSKLPEEAHGDQDKPCIQAEMGIAAAKMAIEAAGIDAGDIDHLICSSAVMQRAFPAIGIEVQHHLGTGGSALDMVMGCSSATYGLLAGVNAIKSGMADRVLMVNPEIFSTMVNYRDRDSHFIFGDIATAVVLERADLAKGNDQWKITGTKAETQFSSNIRSHYGPLTRIDDNSMLRKDMFFVQEGRKVFKELLPLVTEFISTQLEAEGLKVSDLNRMWLHQANINMNMFAAKKLLGREPETDEAPTVLDEYGNTAGAGSIVAFHKNRADLKSGDKGIICSFGAGYSIGSLLVEKL